MTSQPPTPIYTYIGTYTRIEPHARGKAEGISIMRLDPASGELTPVRTVPGVHNPGYVALDPNRRYLYAVNEVPEYDGQPGGWVSAFAIDSETGELAYLNRQPTHGAGPCHVTVDDTGGWVLAANY